MKFVLKMIDPNIGFPLCICFAVICFQVWWIGDRIPFSIQSAKLLIKSCKLNRIQNVTLIN